MDGIQIILRLGLRLAVIACGWSAVDCVPECGSGGEPLRVAEGERTADVDDAGGAGRRVAGSAARSRLAAGNDPVPGIALSVRGPGDRDDL